MNWLDRISYPVLIFAALLLGLAPFRPQPHLWEKLNMLMAGSLQRPLDVFDLFLHGAPLILLGWKVLHDLRKQGRANKAG
ncbi:MAG TPA: RND transporter [Chromatiales bacterium]|nr:RND transporter [Chromatiales bacterium]